MPSDRYVQETLLPPSVVEVTLRVGLVASADHVQYQLDVTNPTDGTLLDMRSWPAVAAHRRSQVQLDVMLALTAAISKYSDPFPEI